MTDANGALTEEKTFTSSGYWFRENEGAFVCCRRVGDHWEGTTPDGTRLQFGLTSNGRIQDGTNSARVFCWMLEKGTDTHGQCILYTHSAFAGSQKTNQKHLAEIRYGPGAPALSPPNGPPWPNYHFARSGPQGLDARVSDHARGLGLPS